MSSTSDSKVTIEKQLIAVIIRGVREYLSTTHFGYISRNGVSGKERGMKLLQLLEVRDTTEHSKLVWPILWSMMESTSKKLKHLVIEHIITSGLLADDIYHRMNMMRMSGEHNVKEEALRQLSSMMMRYDPTTNNLMTELVKFLEIKDKKIDLILISRLDCL
jgi:hypothetical protein